MTAANPCEDCGTDHDGHIPGSVGAAIYCLRLRALRIQSTVARDEFQRSLDKLNSVLSERRDEVLRRHFSDDLT